MQRGYAGEFTITTKNKRLSRVQNEMGISCITMSRSCSACGKDGIGMTKADGSIRSCAPGREEVDYVRRHKMYTRVSRETCLCEAGRAPIKTGWAETDKGQPREAPRAGEVGREGIQDPREARAVRVDAAARGAEGCAVGDRHGQNVEEK